MPHQRLPIPRGRVPWVTYPQEIYWDKQKGQRSDQSQFATLEEQIKDSSWGDTQKIRILGQEETLESEEDLLNANESPLQPPANLEGVENYVVGSGINREDTSKMLSIKDLLVWDEREILFWHHILNHCTLKYLIIWSNTGIIPRNISKSRPPPCVAFLFGKYHKRPWRTKVKHSGGSISNTPKNRPGAMTSIFQIISSQPGLTPQTTGLLIHGRFWADTFFNTTTTNTSMPISWREPHLSKTSRPRNPMSSWHPPTGPGNAPTGSKMEYFKITGLKSQYRPVNNR